VYAVRACEGVNVVNECLYLINATQAGYSLAVI